MPWYGCVCTGKVVFVPACLSVCVCVCVRLRECVRTCIQGRFHYDKIVCPLVRMCVCSLCFVFAMVRLCMRWPRCCSLAAPQRLCKKKGGSDHISWLPKQLLLGMCVPMGCAIVTLQALPS